MTIKMRPWLAGSGILIASALVACSGDDSTGDGTGGTSNDAAGASDHVVSEAGSGGHTGQGDASGGAPAHDSAPESSADLDATSDVPDGPLHCPSLPEGGMYDDVVTSDADVDGGITVSAPETLVATGLYCDVATHTIAPGIRFYQPQFQLWSDGAEKKRWIYLPPGQKIDTTDPDHWSFPVGTKFWKEFKYGGKRVETRLIVRYGEGPNDFLFAAYQWNADETEATLASYSGVNDTAPLTTGAQPPMHDIPSVPFCKNCHEKLPERILSFSAIQLSHSLDGETLVSLVHQDLVTTAPAENGGYKVPGDAVDQAALGYLHANCGNCHNESALTVPRPTPYRVRLLTTDKTLEDTGVFKTAIDVPHFWAGAPPDAGITYRIQSGHADLSELIVRMNRRAPAETGQMPPIATKLVDTAGINALKTWISRLVPREAGAPDGGDGG